MRIIKRAALIFTSWYSLNAKAGINLSIFWLSVFERVNLTGYKRDARQIKTPTIRTTKAMSLFIINKKDSGWNSETDPMIEMIVPIQKRYEDA